MYFTYYTTLYTCQLLGCTTKPIISQTTAESCIVQPWHTQSTFMHGVRHY